MKTPLKPNRDYEVGKGKPPVHSRFKPGQCGNPKGRTKGVLNIRTYFEKAVSETITVRVQDRKIKMTKLEAAVHNSVNKAVTGDPRAFMHLLDELQRHGIGLGVPEAGTGSLPVGEFYASVIERALAARVSMATEPKDEE